MDIIIAGIVIVMLVIITGLSTYFISKETKNTIISKRILFSFENKCEDNLDELIEFSKSNNSNYKI